MRKNSVKNTRINSEVQKVLAETIRGEIKDPRIAPSPQWWRWRYPRI